MQQPRSLFLAALVLGGCTIAPSLDDGGGVEPVARAVEADDIFPGGEPGLDSGCTSSGDHVANSGPSHQEGTCAEGGGFTYEDAVSACGGTVKYYTTSCTDFPPSLPYQPEPQRAWTAYFACCADSGNGSYGPGYGSPPGYGPGYGSRGYGRGYGSWRGPGPEPGYGTGYPVPPLR